MKLYTDKGRTERKEVYKAAKLALNKEIKAGKRTRFDNNPCQSESLRPRREVPRHPWTVYQVGNRQVTLLTNEELITMAKSLRVIRPRSGRYSCHTH